PSDCAFEDFLGNLSAWSRDDLRATFLYHVSPGLFSTETLGELSTLPTLLNQSALYIDGMPQRLTLRLEDEELVVGSQAMIKVADIVSLPSAFPICRYTHDINQMQKNSPQRTAIST